MSKHDISHLNNLTLILNASYLPLGVCNSKRAICLYFLDNKLAIVDPEIPLPITHILFTFQLQSYPQLKELAH